MNRTIFQKVSALRRREAGALLSAGQYAGAYYLAGYAVECALKACVAKQIMRHDFPDRKFVNDAYTHKLGPLLKLAGLASDLEKDMVTNRNLELNWAVTKDWSESSRYKLDITETDARDLYLACTARKHGVLSWIRKRW